MKKRITYSLLCFIFCFIGGLSYGQTMYDVEWENLSKATFSLPTLQRASGSNITGKATSSNMLFGTNPKGRAMYLDGFMTYTSNSTNQTKKIGFSVTATSNTEITNAIDYGFAFQSNGKVKAFTADEASNLVNYTTSDEFKIERREEMIMFFVGATKVLEVKCDPTETLMLRAELNSNNSNFIGVKVSFNTKHFIVDPVIDNTNNTMKMYISGGMPNFEYRWEDGELLKYPDLFVKEKGFSKGLHQLRITDAALNEYERLFLVGNDVSWTSFNNTQQSGTTLSKTTSTGWGSALSTTTIGNQDYFWVQYVADVQQVNKAFGVTYASSAFSQYTHLQAGFMMLPENQLQVIYQGNIVLTTEYGSRDALLISSDAKGLQWMINGKTIFQAAPNFTTDLKVGGLLKDNASLNKVSVFNINNKPLLSAWSATDLKGSVTANITSLTNGNSPYHYFISENPIPPLYDIYLAKDTIFGDTVLDSLTFFQGNHLPVTTQFTFPGLDPGVYYVSVFDKEGLLIMGNTINVAPPLALLNSNHISLNTSLITSTQNNATSDLNYYIDEELEESRIDFIVKNASEKYSMGLSDFAATTTAIQYGFFVNSKTVKFYVNGTLENTKYSVKNNNILSLEKVGTTLYYKINDVVFRQVALTGPYLLKTQFDIAKAGTTIEVVAKEPLVKLYKFSSTILNATCAGGVGSLSFGLTKKPHLNGVIFSYDLTSLTGPESYHGNLPSGTSILPINNIPYGTYLLTASTNTNPVVQVNEILVVAVEGGFDPLNNYLLSPNSYSLKKSGSTWASAISLNTLNATQTGWFSFTPVFAPGGSWFTFGYNNLTISSDYSLTNPNSNWRNSVVTYKFLGMKILRIYDHNGIIIYNQTYTGDASVRVDLGTDISYKLNNNVVATSARPANESLHVKAFSQYNQDGMKDLLFSFGCIDTKIYAQLERKLTGVKYKPINNKVYFYYQEEYSDLPATLSYKIYKVGDHVNEMVLATQISDYKYGDNRFSADVTSLAAGAYTLEVENSKKEKFYLRFIK